MTSFRLSELPIPYRSAGASPLGTHEGTVTPPEPPTPPTPTGKTYFSGTSTEREQIGPTAYGYIFDASAFENADAFFAIADGSPLSVVLNGAELGWKIQRHEVVGELTNIIIAEDDFLTGGSLNVGFTDDGGGRVLDLVYFTIDTDNPPESATLVIADPS